MPSAGGRSNGHRDGRCGGKGAGRLPHVQPGPPPPTSSAFLGPQSVVRSFRAGFYSAGGERFITFSSPSTTPAGRSITSIAATTPVVRPRRRASSWGGCPSLGMLDCCRGRRGNWRPGGSILVCFTDGWSSRRTRKGRPVVSTACKAVEKGGPFEALNADIIVDWERTGGPHRQTTPPSDTRFS